MRRLTANPTLQHCLATDASVSTDTAVGNGANLTEGKIEGQNIIAIKYTVTLLATRV